MSGTRRFWFGNVSADSMQFGVMSDLIRSWIGLESVSGWPTYARYITDLRPTNHLPSVAELRPTRPRTLPDTTPTYNRQTTDNLSGRDLSNMFERSLPDKFVCPYINQHQTDKTESIPTVNRSLPEFEDFCRFEVGLVSFWPVWLGYKSCICSRLALLWWKNLFMEFNFCYVFRAVILLKYLLESLNLLNDLNMQNRFSATLQSYNIVK